MISNLEKVEEVLKASKNTVVLTGAGMSTESGIPDFRSQNGLYKKVKNAEEVLSSSYFYNHPDDFYQFINEYMYFPEIKPNIGHKILSDWEKRGIIEFLITQNIDGLHQAAGSKKVLEIHGTMNEYTCTKCGKKYSVEETIGKNIHYCNCGKNSLIRPDIVLYDEMVSRINDAVLQVKNADVFLILGTSMTVYPVAALPNYMKNNAKLIIINKGSTPYDNWENCLKISEGIGNTLSSINELL